MTPVKYEVLALYYSSAEVADADADADVGVVPNPMPLLVVDGRSVFDCGMQVAIRC